MLSVLFSSTANYKLGLRDRIVITPDGIRFYKAPRLKVGSHESVNLAECRLHICCLRVTDTVQIYGFPWLHTMSM